MKICVIIPTYNNSGTLMEVVQSVLSQGLPVIVVNDGSTDQTLQLLAKVETQITLISYSPNKGKGYALRQGFAKARQMRFTTAITMDSDGQHPATDIPLLIAAAEQNQDVLVVGSRRFDHPNMPQKNSFANRFSNFWFTIQTGIRLPDTQTGFRIYPLNNMPACMPLCHRYEGELETLVRCAWRGIQLVSVPINVYYPPKEERISHFRPTVDFVRISLLNTILCVFSVLYGYPSRFIHSLLCKKL